MRITGFLVFLFFISCTDSDTQGILGEWRAISFESDECQISTIPEIPYNRPNDNLCMYTVYGYVCDLVFRFDPMEEATLSFVDRDGNTHSIPYKHWQLDDNIYSVFTNSTDGIKTHGWAGKIEGGELILGDNPLWYCDVYEFRWKRL